MGGKRGLASCLDPASADKKRGYTPLGYVLNGSDVATEHSDPSAGRVSFLSADAGSSGI